MSGLVRIIAHWTGGAYRASNLDKKHYHFIYESDGKEVAGNNRPEDNISARDGVYGAHTRRLNTGSIGVSMACMAGAEPTRFGKYPMTERQFDAMCAGIARLCKKYGIPVTPETVLSHAEVQPTLKVAQRGKWDFTVLPFNNSFVGARACGNEMRRRVKLFLTGGKTNKVRSGPKIEAYSERTQWLQGLLVEEGIELEVDGLIGPQTREMVSRFERFHKLPETGSLETRQTVDLLVKRAHNRREVKAVEVERETAAQRPIIEDTAVKAVVEDVAAEGRFSKMQTASIVGSGAALLSPVTQLVDQAEQAQGLMERVMSLGPWVLAAVCVAAAVFVYRDRSRQKKNARAAKAIMDLRL